MTTIVNDIEQWKCANCDHQFTALNVEPEKQEPGVRVCFSGGLDYTRSPRCPKCDFSSATITNRRIPHERDNN